MYMYMYLGIRGRAVTTPSIRDISMAWTLIFNVQLKHVRTCIRTCTMYMYMDNYLVYLCDVDAVLFQQLIQRHVGH